MREDGCIHLTGRSRDVIIRGGENIYPREVEEFLYTHPKVDEVQVVGIPNARLGEIVAAWVRLRPGLEAHRRRDSRILPGPDRLLQDSRAHPLRHEFPATLSGKIQKYKMREFEIEARGKLAGRRIAKFAAQATAWSHHDSRPAERYGVAALDS
jgi:fatty-acyl-CoA synthase